MLPYKDKQDKEASNLCAVVLDYWDVIGEYVQNNLPTLCTTEFRADAKQV